MQALVLEDLRNLHMREVPKLLSRCLIARFEHDPYAVDTVFGGIRETEAETIVQPPSDPTPDLFMPAVKTKA